MSLSSLNEDGDVVPLPLDVTHARRGSVPSSDIPRLLPLPEILRLYERCQMQIDTDCSPVVELVGSVPGEGTSTVATETALVVSGILQRRTLFVDATSGRASRLARTLERHVSASLDQVMTGRAPILDALASLPDLDLHYATIETGGLYGSRLPPLRALHSLLNRLRNHYDFILVDGGNMRSGAFSPILARAVDGVVLVIEAERTRAPVVEQAVELLEASRAKLLGAVLNKRRFHIPGVFYDSL
ncbi:MAG TPA: hypothetical protein VKS60_01975 [Stellaceae bacterium]|nr:hypothetical protein [Stellaceae bacterium]